MNKWIGLGNLTSDPEIQTTTTGKSVCKFTVAINSGKDRTSFVNCQAWNKTAEFVSRYFSKGKSIVVVGSFQTDKYTDKRHEDVTHYSSFILVESVEFAGHGSNMSSSPLNCSENKEQEVIDRTQDITEESSEDIPF